MYNKDFQKQQALRLLNTHLGRKPSTKVFINNDPNAAAILEMQGARIHKGRNYDVTVLPPELVNDEYFNEYTLPYMKPGQEIMPMSQLVDPYGELAQQQRMAEINAQFQANQERIAQERRAREARSMMYSIPNTYDDVPF